MNKREQVAHTYNAMDVLRIDRVDMDKYVWPAKVDIAEVRYGTLNINLDVNPSDYNKITRKVDFAIAQAVKRSQAKPDFEPEE